MRRSGSNRVTVGGARGVERRYGESMRAARQTGDGLERFVPETRHEEGPRDIAREHGAEVSADHEPLAADAVGATPHEWVASKPRLERGARRVVEDAIASATGDEDAV